MKDKKQKLIEAQARYIIELEKYFPQEGQNTEALTFLKEKVESANLEAQ